MGKLDNVLLRSKFRGALLGSLLGDCLGAPFEGDTMSVGDRLVLQNYFDKLSGSHFPAPYKNYTDDTAMTKCVAKCLIDKPPVDYKFLARLFVKEYYTEPNRGYGANVVEVFGKLRSKKFDDIFKPAKEQFNGSGSYGNGGAMRIAPVALYFHDNYRAMIEAATKITEITHANKLGIHGALLQCMAIQQSLYLLPNEKIDRERFMSQLIDKLKSLENDEEGLGISVEAPYQNRLMKIIEFLNKPEDVTHEEIVQSLGNSISALHSVPTAIYCFLRAQEDIPGIETKDKFRRTLQYAISLGGDTDTIASMAGALVGAYLGDDFISENFMRHCEANQEISQIADNLFTATENCT